MEQLSKRISSETHEKLSESSTAFLTCVENDLPLIKLYKFRHYLENFPNFAIDLLPSMLEYALEKNYIGEYEEIMKLAKQDISKTGEYKVQRDKMIEETNEMRRQIEHAEEVVISFLKFFESNLEDMTSRYLKLARYYRVIGQHQEASRYYSKLFRCPSQVQGQGQEVPLVRREVYFSEWAEEMFMNDDRQELSKFLKKLNILDMFLRCDIEDNNKRVSATLAIIKDLKTIEAQSYKFFSSNAINPSNESSTSATKLFENILGINPESGSPIYSIEDVLNNKIISYSDMGLIYSLVALAKKGRQYLTQSKHAVKWSAKLETLFLKNQFKELLDEMARVYQSRGRFHPFIDLVYKRTYGLIKERILLKYLSAFVSVGLKEIEENTTYTEKELKNLLTEKTLTIPYLFDPIKQSIVYSEKSVPLYQEALWYDKNIRYKHSEAVNSFIQKKQNNRMDEMFARGEGFSGGRSRKGGNFGIGEKKRKGDYEIGRGSRGIGNWKRRKHEENRDSDSDFE